MKKKWVRLIVVMLAVLVVVGVVAALDDDGNPNDPTVNDRANACYEDGSMAGKCDTDAEWAAGWYLIRFEYSLLNRDQVPAWVAWVLPPEVVPEELVEQTEPPPPPTCTMIWNGTENSSPVLVNWFVPYTNQSYLSFNFNNNKNVLVSINSSQTSWESKYIGDVELTSLTVTLLNSGRNALADADCTIIISAPSG